MANEKVITTKALIEKFEQALSEKWGYIWGTAGVLWTAARQAALEKTTDADREQGRLYGAKWIGHKVADCSGLFSWAFKQLGGYMYHGSNTMWDKYCTAKGDLKDGKRTDGQPLLPGTAVFTRKMKNGKLNRGHVGLYIGNGWVIEAAGTKAGVVKTKVTNSKWVEWGELKGLDYSGAEPAPAPDPEPVSRPTIRKGNRNRYVTEMQTMLQKLGYDLGICGADGDFGTATEKALKEFQRDNGLQQDGVCGPKSWSALEKAIGKISEKPAEERWTVTIPNLTKEQAEELCRTWKGATSKNG